MDSKLTFQIMQVNKVHSPKQLLNSNPSQLTRSKRTSKIPQIYSHLVNNNPQTSSLNIQEALLQVVLLPNRPMQLYLFLPQIAIRIITHTHHLSKRKKPLRMITNSESRHGNKHKDLLKLPYSISTMLMLLPFQQIPFFYLLMLPLNLLHSRLPMIKNYQPSRVTSLKDSKRRDSNSKFKEMK